MAIKIPLDALDESGRIPSTHKVKSGLAFRLPNFGSCAASNLEIVRAADQGTADEGEVVVSEIVCRRSSTCPKSGCNAKKGNGHYKVY